MALAGCIMGTPVEVRFTEEATGITTTYQLTRVR
jgi:hypothetical protein